MQTSQLRGMHSPFIFVILLTNNGIVKARFVCWLTTSLLYLEILLLIFLIRARSENYPKVFILTNADTTKFVAYCTQALFTPTENP